MFYLRNKYHWYISFAFFLCMAASYSFLVEFQYLVRLIPDDGYYYLKIAMNIVGGYGSSFDQINETNGYHPLWLILLVILAAPGFDSPELFVRVVIFVSMLLNFACALYCYKFSNYIIKDHILRGLLAFAVFVLISSFTVYAMEDPLKYLLIFSTLFYLGRVGVFPEGVAQPLLVGVLLSLCILSRLDLGLMWLSYLSLFVISVLCSQTSVARFQSVIISSLVIISVLISYVVFNSVLFDTGTPVSGKLKSTFPFLAGYSPYWSLTSTVHKASVIISLLAFFIVCLGVLRSICLKKIDLDISLLFILLSSIAGFAVYQLFFVNWANMFSWYQLPAVMATAIAFFYVADKLYFYLPDFFLSFKRIGLVVFSIVLVCLLSLRLCKAHFSLEDDFPYSIYSVAKEVNEKFPKDAIFALKDTGAFSFYSQRKVINLDGLVNSFDYYDQLIDEGIPGYLHLKEVDYFVDQSLVDSSDDVKSGNYEQYLFRLENRLNEKEIEPLVLASTQETLRASYKDGKKTLVIWSLE